MIKPLLRSGSYDDFIAQGENGKKVFDYALQIIETLRLRQQQTIIQSLAIPKLNVVNKRIDWYAPEDGQIIPWAGASAAQRLYALDYLERCQKELQILIQHDRQSVHPAAQLFATLLPLIMHFPGENHIYLVNSLPVITFWGFTHPENIHKEKILDRLRTALPPRMPDKNDAGPEARTQPLFTPAPPQPPESAHNIHPVHQDNPAPAHNEKTTPAPAARRTWRRNTLLVIIFIWAVAIFSLSVPELTPQPSSPRIDTVITPPLPLVRQTLPVQQAQLTTPPPPPPAPAPVPAPIQTPPTIASVVVPKGMLVLPKNSVKVGSVKFLNGSWRVQPGAHNIHQFPALIYKFYKGEGKATAIYKKNTCTAALNFGLMPSGNLVVKYHGRAKCSDGSRMSFPEIVCHQALTGPAECSGSIADGTEVPVTFRRVKG